MNREKKKKRTDKEKKRPGTYKWSQPKKNGAGFFCKGIVNKNIYHDLLKGLPSKKIRVHREEALPKKELLEANAAYLLEKNKHLLPPADKRPDKHQLTQTSRSLERLLHEEDEEKEKTAVPSVGGILKDMNKFLARKRLKMINICPGFLSVEDRVRKELLCFEELTSNSVAFLNWIKSTIDMRIVSDRVNATHDDLNN